MKNIPKKKMKRGISGNLDFRYENKTILSCQNFYKLAFQRFSLKVHQTLNGFVQRTSVNSARSVQ